MMTSLLIDLCNGNLSPIEDSHDSEEMRQLISLMNINHDKLQTMLNREVSSELLPYSLFLIT